MIIEKYAYNAYVLVTYMLKYSIYHQT